MANSLSYPVRPGGLSPEDHAEIFKLAERGWRSTRIAREIEKHPSTVQWFMYRNGLKAPGYQRRTTSTRNGRVVKPFTPDEDAFITALRLQGLSPKKIAELTTERFGHPRSGPTVAHRLIMLAARDDEPAEPAHA